MSIADKYRPQYTYADYCLWEGDWELIDGMPYAMSPSPIKQHQVVNGKLYIAFNDAISTDCEQCSVYMPLDWKVNEKTVVQPDLMVVCKEFTTDFLHFAPDVVVEILSPSTAFKDRHEKFELYEQEGVKYYIIADPKFKKIEIYQLIDGRYEPVAVTPDHFTFTLENGCQLPVSLSNVWQ